MARKTFVLNDGSQVTIYKRRSNRSLRLSVTPAGEIRVTIPSWAPYRVGLEFAHSKQEWIRTQTTAPVLLTDGQAVGKAHHLSFMAIEGLAKPTSRVSKTVVTVNYPAQSSSAAADVQKIAREACVRALRSQAEKLLPQRLAALAQTHGFEYADVRVKRLKGRWGSCDQHRNIVLNLYLMQLPWELIDYVLLHELTHTKVLRHGPDFWRDMEAVMPRAQKLRRQMRDYQPVLG